MYRKKISTSSANLTKNSSPEHNVIQKSYMIVAAVEVIVLLCFCASLQYTLQAVSEEVKYILDTSLGKYLTNTAWRTFWDQFQQHYFCCGSSQSTDWFQTPWASPILSSFYLLQKYTQENGKFIVPAAPSSCCLPNTICNAFTDCEQTDITKYYPNGCFSVIADTINSIASIRYFFNAILIIQSISTITKYEGFTDDETSKFKL